MGELSIAQRHAWCEFLVPEYGWLPADPTWGRRGGYFAEMDNAHIVGSVEKLIVLNRSGLDVAWSAGSGDPNKVEVSENIVIERIG